MSSTPQDQYLAVCKELERLNHDIARHVQIATEQAQELEQLRQDLAAARALLRYPVAWMAHWETSRGTEMSIIGFDKNELHPHVPERVQLVPLYAALAAPGEGK